MVAAAFEGVLDEVSDDDEPDLSDAAPLDFSVLDELLVDSALPPLGTVDDPLPDSRLSVR